MPAQSFIERHIHLRQLFNPAQAAVYEIISYMLFPSALFGHSGAGGSRAQRYWTNDAAGLLPVVFQQPSQFVESRQRIEYVLEGVEQRDQRKALWDFSR